MKKLTPVTPPTRMARHSRSSPANRGRTRSDRWCWHWALEKAIWSCCHWATSVHPADHSSALRARPMADCQTSHLFYCTTLADKSYFPSVVAYSRMKHHGRHSWSKTILASVCILWIITAYLCMYIVYACTTQSGWFAPQNHPSRSNLWVAYPHPKWCLVGPNLPEGLLDAIHGIIAQVLVLSSVGVRDLRDRPKISGVCEIR